MFLLLLKICCTFEHNATDCEIIQLAQHPSHLNYLTCFPTFLPVASQLAKENAPASSPQVHKPATNTQSSNSHEIELGP